MTFKQRPLSPHLQIYKLPLTGLISISHRITGVLLCLGFPALLGMLFSISNGEAAFQSMQAFLTLPLINLLLWAFIYALLFHLCHGVRHLLWDIGLGFQPNRLQTYALYEILASLFLTGLVYLLL